MLWLAGCFFVLAALTRQMAPVYVAGVIVLVGYVFAINLLGDMENKTLAALVDPSGATALDVLARYWTVAQKNSRADSARRRPAVEPRAVVRGRRRRNRARLSRVPDGSGHHDAARASGTRRRPLRARTRRRGHVAVPVARLDRSAGAFARMLPGLARLYLSEILRSPRFLTIMLGGVLLVIGNAVTLGSIYGTNTYPLTYKVLDVVGGLFGVFILIVTAIYAGELVWRERDARMDDITDSAPAPTWLAFLAKFVALVVLQAVLMLLVLVCSIGVQLAQGFHPHRARPLPVRALRAAVAGHSC